MKAGVNLCALEVWFCDEARIRRKHKIARRWAKRGTRPSAPRDQRTASTYIFGAICPNDSKGAGLIPPLSKTQAMDLRLQEVAEAVAPGKHAVLLLDLSDKACAVAGQAGICRPSSSSPDNVALLPLPPERPELNPTENIWQFMRNNWLSNRVFKSYEDIVDRCCYAWNKLIDQPWRIISIGMRDWAHKF